MSHLILELKPGETMLINGAAIRFRTRTRLELVSRARFLFGKQIMPEEEAVTPARRLYHALQTAYVGNEADRASAIGSALALLDADEEGDRGEARASLAGAIREAIGAGESYTALKLARRMIADERGTASPRAVRT